MNRITFRQFILTYNFRDINQFNNDDDQFDTSIIRIYLPNDEFHKHEWFEFGIYDFSEDSFKMEMCERIFSKEILDSYIASFEYNDSHENVFTVYLSKDKKRDFY